MAMASGRSVKVGVAVVVADVGGRWQLRTAGVECEAGRGLVGYLHGARPT